MIRSTHMKRLFARGTKRRFFLTSLAAGFPITMWMLSNGDGDPSPWFAWIFFTLVVVIPVRLFWIAFTNPGKGRKAWRSLTNPMAAEQEKAAEAAEAAAEQPENA
jgi:hypothetical protein